MKQNYKKRRIRSWLIALIILTITSLSGFRLSAQGCTPPGASISPPDTLSCGHQMITLHGAPSTAGVSYLWSGPYGFASFSQNPSVSMPGTYNLTVTSPSGGCTSTASVNVLQDIVQPDASTHVSGILNCSTGVVTVSGISSVQHAVYNWIGPNGSIPNQQNITVGPSNYRSDLADGYTLMVVNTVNGCISTATASVYKNFELPTVSGYVSGDITCDVNSVQLTSSSATAGVNYSWSGPGFGSPVLAQNTTTSVGGLYTVTATNPVNSCSSWQSVNVIRDINEPGAIITASNTVITCSAINAELSGGSPSTGVSYSWSGPNTNIAVQNITVATAGAYILTAEKAQNGCISKDTVEITVDKNRPDATGIPSGPITCSTTTITLNGSSITPGVNYKWMGPSAFGTVYTQNPTTYTSGGYILSVTNPTNGCITTKPVVVQKNITPPASITATNNGPLTCAATSIALTGYSSTSGATFSWLGPNGAIYSGTNPSVSILGRYYLTVTNPVNGCTATTNTTVAGDVTLPSSVTANNDGPITCIKTNATLSGNSSTPGVTYEWRTLAGAVLGSTKNYVVTESGLYRLYVTNPSNGCTTSSLTSVGLNNTKPQLILAGNDGPLTCANLTAALNASSSTQGVSYKWSGPGGFSSTTKNPTVNVSGTYKVVFTNTQNGCKDSTSTVLMQNAVLPGIVISAPQLLTCNTSMISLSASSSTSGVLYNWTGPDNFYSSGQSSETDKPGKYIIAAINPVNNCVSKDSITVSQDIAIPTGVTASVSDTLTCTRLIVSLAATSGTGNVTFGWTGPNGYISSVQNPSVGAKGNYTVTVTNQANGCKSFASTVVEKDSMQPADINASVSGILNCANASVILTGSSSTQGVTYRWVGPGVNTTSAITSASSTGTYNLTVTNQHNGCYGTTGVAVTENHTTPTGISATASGILTCSEPHRTITVPSAPSDVDFSWTGPGSFISNEHTPTVDVPGLYTVIVTNQVSKCPVTRTVTVSQDTTKPVNVMAEVSGIINCNDKTVTLTGSTTSSPVTYYWDGPGDFNSDMPMPIVSNVGLYTLTVTKTLNGCSLSKTVFVEIDTVPPANVTAEVSNSLDCNNTSAMLTGYSSTNDAGYEWFFMDNSYDPNPVTFAIMEGDYTLVVTHPVNGCTVTRVVTVVDNHTPPLCNLDVPDNSTVLSGTANTISTVYDPSYSYNWTITNWGIVSGQGTQTLNYISGTMGSTSHIAVDILDNTNGCVSDCGVNLSAVDLKSAVSEDDGLILNELTLNTYPVPTIDKVFIEFASPEKTEVNITIYNINGSVVANLFNSNIEARRSYKLTFNEAGALPSGTYLCILKSKSKTLYSNIIIE